MEGLRNYISLIGRTLILCFIISLGGACTANKYQSAWMDVPHAKRLDQKKGNQSKKIMKSHSYVQRK